MKSLSQLEKAAYAAQEQERVAVRKASRVFRAMVEPYERRTKKATDAYLLERVRRRLPVPTQISHG